MEAKLANPRFEITAVWDGEAEVWISQSDIQGLHVEAETLEEFEAAARAYAAELIVENHYKDENIDISNLKDWIPTINWRSDTNPGTLA